MSKQRGLISFANLWFELATTIHFFGSLEINPASQYFKYLIFSVGQSVHYWVALCPFNFCVFCIFTSVLRFISLLADCTELLAVLYLTRLGFFTWNYSTRVDDYSRNEALHCTCAESVICSSLFQLATVLPWYCVLLLLSGMPLDWQ